MADATISTGNQQVKPFNNELIDQDLLKQDLAKAMNDPLFIQDLEASMNAFDLMDDEDIKDEV